MKEDGNLCYGHRIELDAAEANRWEFFYLECGMRCRETSKNRIERRANRVFGSTERLAQGEVMVGRFSREMSADDD